MTPAQRRTKNPPYQMTYSSKLKEKVIIARDEKAARSIRNPQHVIYTQQEADMLKGQSDDCIKMCHECKKIFGGTIISITKDENGKDQPIQ